MSGFPRGVLIQRKEINRQHHYFDEVMTILICSFTFTISMELIAKHRSPLISSSQETLLDAEFPFAAMSEDKVYSFHFYRILNGIIIQQQPDIIHYNVYKKAFKDTDDVPDVSVLKNSDSHYFIYKVIAGSYLTYYDKVIRQIIDQYSNDPKRWPALFQFARVVRNAFGHNCKITISNRDDSAVKWRNISYTYADNGKWIFSDFYIVEIIDLFQDIESSLPY